ncbi:GNAT family N-acetyltransferase [Streptomyces sp. Tu 2975]|uniref:GNAT family N-acetyltransferase n=1 Tax=Streptomyces sp. Tu 2975 TaxID=2676871 RepID=UPI00135C6885|nr:GNAT family protein [Streptomyces sp. Tu 2975]QIP82780.1 GNAT family N-acetyltransferase [Streptomyces sp. Tu 2975]
MAQHSVILRRIELADWRAVHSWASLAQVCRFQTWGPNTEEETRAFVVAAVEAWSASPQQRFAYVARVEGDVVGMGELHLRSRGQRQGEITYAVHPRVWGQGVGTAIGKGLLVRGFEDLELHRVHATCDPRNLGSARILGKLGMTWEGRHRHTALIRDGWRDSEVFSILEDEWRALTPSRAHRTDESVSSRGVSSISLPQSPCLLVTVISVGRGASRTCGRSAWAGSGAAGQVRR